MSSDDLHSDPIERVARRERLVVAVVLVVLAGMVLWQAPDYLSGPEPVGEDSSSHILASATIAQHIRDGSGGWWMPHLNLGFPLAHFYQPLAHCVTALAALALGGPEEATDAYKGIVVVLLLLFPGAAYVGFRRFGLERAGALGASLALVAFSTPKDDYGPTTRHFLLSGLYTLLFGAVLAPLALGEGVRFVQGRGRAVLAIPAYAALFLAHGLLGLGMIPVYAIAAVAGGAERSSFRARFLRLVALGAGCGVLISSWLLPQLSCSDFFAGWPIGDPERADGLGLGPLFAELGSGRLTDFRHWPVVAVLALVGLVAAFVRVRRAECRVVLAGLALFTVFTAGRKTFGAAVDWVFPPNKNIEGMLRWVALLDLFLVLAAGLGVQALVDGAKRLRGGALAGALVPLALLAFTVPRYASDLDWGLANFFESMDRPAYVRVADALRDDPHTGRVWSAGRTGFDNHWTLAYLTMLTGKSMTLSKGVGVNESLNFYYLWYYDPFDPDRGAGESRLFDVRYLLVRSDVDVSALGAETLVRAGPYVLLRLPGDYGMFEVIDAPEVVEGARPTELRKTFLRWLKREFPRGAVHLCLAEPLRVRGPSLPAKTRGTDETEPPAAHRRAARPAAQLGAVLEEHEDLRSYRARVAVTAADAWTMLKVTPHPFWSATVDGAPAPIHVLSPAYMGVALPPGEHEVVFVFHNPAWQVGLLALAPLFLAGLVVFDRRRKISTIPGQERTRAPDPPAPAPPALP